MNAYILPPAARSPHSKPSSSARSSSTPSSRSPSAARRRLAARVIATQVIAAGVHEGRLFKPGTIPTALFVGTGLALMAYAWLAFEGLIPWWSR